MMSAHSVNGGLGFNFLEMVKRTAVLFLETVRIKGYLEKPKMFSACSLKPRVMCPFLLAFPVCSLICTARRIALYLVN